jgi:MFS family permease
MLFYTFLIIHFLHSVTLHATRPIISLFADSQGASAMIIGILFSVYAFFPMLMAIRVGKWLDQYGSWKIAFIGGSGVLLSLLIPFFYPGLGTLFFLQIFMGFSQLCITVSLQKTVGNLPGNRDKLIATFTFTGAMGGLVGPLLSGFSYDHFGFQVSIGISAVITLASLCIGLALGRDSWKSGQSVYKMIPEEPGSTWQMLRHVNLRKALIISGLVLYSKDLFVAYFPIYATHLGMTPSYIGLLLSISAGVAMTVRLVQFWLVKTFGRGKILFITLLISGFTFLLIPFTTVPVFLGILSALLGAGLGLGQPLSLVYALKVSPEGRQGEVLGMRLTFNRASQFTAPILFGGIGGLLGLFPIFWVSGGILLLGAYFTRLTPANKTNVFSQDELNKNST